MGGIPFGPGATQQTHTQAVLTRKHTVHYGWWNYAIMHAYNFVHNWRPNQTNSA